MQRKIWTIVLLILLGAVVGVGGWRQYLEKQQKEKAQTSITMPETVIVAPDERTMVQPTSESTSAQKLAEGGEFNDEATTGATETVLTVTIGELIEATMNNITILTHEKKELNFLTTDAQMITGEKGLLLGETVAVTYDEETPIAANYWVAQVVKVIE